MSAVAATVIDINASVILGTHFLHKAIITRKINKTFILFYMCEWLKLSSRWSGQESCQMISQVQWVTHFLSSKVEAYDLATRRLGHSFHFVSAFIAVHSNHLTASSSERWSLCRPSSESIVNVHSFTICDIVCANPRSHLSEDARSHLCRFVAVAPRLVWKRFSVHHVRQGRSKPGCWVVGSVTNDWFTTVVDSQKSHHATFKLNDAVSIQIGCRDIRCWVGWSKMSLWTGHFGCVCTLLSRKESHAAFHHSTHAAGTLAPWYSKNR